MLILMSGLFVINNFVFSEEVLSQAKLNDIPVPANIENSVIQYGNKLYLKLTDDEYSEIKNHPKIGAQILSNATLFEKAIPIVKHHHERWNGTGYPMGLKGEEIPLLSRIIALVDSHDVMTHNRPYHRAMSHEAAIVEIKRCAGKEFDPYISEVFIELLHELKLDGD